ncbi:Gfo/Idh/MocA family protein [Leucobacter musarum]|uniref:Gfo/Idh/MocA family protein n=1 Tax=Leucobacter musarum TaxID=1930747 RepID=UPI0006A795BC|nr:Gfo/Idh/MocA family oxidoreductase [Leucobacter musarum]
MSAPGDLRWGIIGASWMARTWMVNAINAVPGNTVAAVSSSSNERGADFARDFGIGRTFTSWEEMVADPEIDAVYVGSTNDLHLPQTLAALGNGVHVLTEKPVALTVADAELMERTALAAGLVLRPNHHLRFMDTHRTVRRVISEGLVGRVLSVRVNHTRYLPTALQGWRLTDPAGGGIAYDITVHDADTLRFLLDDEIESVAATPLYQGMGQGVEDGVMGVMSLASGAHAVFHESYAQPHSGTSVEIHGTDGVLIADDILNAHPAGTLTLLQNDEAPREIETGPRANAYERLIGEFSESVATGAPGLGFGHAIRSLEVAVATRAAMASGVRVTVGA